MFFNVCLYSHSFPHHADWRKRDSSVDGEPGEYWRWNSNSRDVVASSPTFSCPAARAPRRPYSQATLPAVGVSAAFFSKRNHCELIPTTVVICVNPFTPTSDQYQFSPYNFNTFLREKVHRIYKIITKEEMLLFFIKFSSPSGSLKNNIEFSHFGPFSVALSFLNHY